MSLCAINVELGIYFTCVPNYLFILFDNTSFRVDLECFNFQKI